MKRYEFYVKYKINDHIFHKTNWWRIVTPFAIAVLIEPLILYVRQRSISFTLDGYLELLEYCFLIIIPFLSIFLWLNWREWLKRTRGYGWIGKFEVVSKQSSFIFCYLLLAPGNFKLKVQRSLFEKTRIGNSIQIRRDALGKIEEIKRVNDLSSRLSRIGAKRSSKGSSGPSHAAGFDEQDLKS